jgi:hypothetical protein
VEAFGPPDGAAFAQAGVKASVEMPDRSSEQREV